MDNHSTDDIRHHALDGGDLTALVHSLYQKHHDKITLRRHGKRYIGISITSELLAFKHADQQARIVLERTKEDTKVPDTYHLDYTARIEFVDLGIVISLSSIIGEGVYVDVYSTSTFKILPVRTRKGVLLRAQKLLQDATIVDYDPKQHAIEFGDDNDEDEEAEDSVVSSIQAPESTPENMLDAQDNHIINVVEPENGAQ